MRQSDITRIATACGSISVSIKRAANWLILQVALLSVLQMETLRTQHLLLLLLFMIASLITHWSIVVDFF